MTADPSIATIVDDALAGWRRAEERPRYVDFARRLVLPGGPQAGKAYDPQSEPIQRYIIEQMDSGRWRRIYHVAIPQLSGKTTVDIILPAMRNAVGCGLPVGYGLPTLKDLEKTWVSKLKPQFEGSGFGAYLPKQGPGSRGGVPSVLQLRDPASGDRRGSLVFMAGGGYSDTVAAMVVDEVDQLRHADGTPRWDDLEDMMHRADAYRNDALRIACGTIEHDRYSIVLVLVNKHGTGTRLWPRCQICGRYQALDWSQLRYDASSVEAALHSACVHCEHCDAPWNIYQHEAALHDGLMVHRGQHIDERGRITGPEPQTGGILGIYSNALDCALAVDQLGEIAAEEIRAQQQIDEDGDHELMRKFYHYRRVETYHGDEQESEALPEVSPEVLAARSQAHGFADLEHHKDGLGLFSRHLAELPREATHVAAALDVQGDRLYWMVTAYETETWREWDVGWGYECATSPPEPWREGELRAVFERCDAMLDEHFATGHADMHARVIDSNFEPELIAEILRDHQRWRGLRGIEEGRLPKTITEYVPGLLGWDDRWLPGLGRFVVATKDALRQVHDAYLRAPDVPLSASLPLGLRKGDAYLRHICAWRYQLNERTHKAGWVRYQRRDDWGDCRAYNKALIRLHRAVQKQQAQTSAGQRRRRRRGSIIRR